MLEIHMKNRVRENGIVSQLSINDLFRTIRPAAEGAVFIEPVPGTLLNLCHVERIIELTEEVELVDRGVPASPMLGTKACPHGYIEGTCSQCAIERLDSHGEIPIVRYPPNQAPT